MTDSAVSGDINLLQGQMAALATPITVGTVGVEIDKNMLAKDGPLSPATSTIYRSIAERSNYVGPDRPDAQYASKELCRWMAGPSETGLQGLKRRGRYF